MAERTLTDGPENDDSAVNWATLFIIAAGSIHSGLLLRATDLASFPRLSFCLLVLRLTIAFDMRNRDPLLMAV